MRGPVQDSSATGRQMPEVTRVGPQSQPKLQAILRMKAYGSVYAPGRSPSLSRSASAYVYGAVKRTSMVLAPSRSSGRTGKR